MWRHALRRRLFEFVKLGERKNYCTTSERKTSFGFEEVTEGTKAKKVQEVFTSVAGSYDVMNDIMSVGLHRLWKDYFVRKLAPPTGAEIIDVAGGTGDIASRIVNYNDKRGGGEVGEDDEPVQVTVVDVNPEMLREGEKKLSDKNFMLRIFENYHSANISWIEGDALSLPFPSDSFDAYTIAFGIRNVANFETALAEAFRVLKGGGRFLCMEFSFVENALLRNFYDIYSFQLIPVFGELIAQDRPSYQYLVESIRQFPDQESFAEMISNAGFCHVTYESLLGGVVAIHSGFKPVK